MYPSFVDYLHAALHNISGAAKGNLYKNLFRGGILHTWYSFKINVRFIFSHLLKRLF